MARPGNMALTHGGHSKVKKLFLHIGFNKTGSTSIQNALVENADHLAQNGFFYPCMAGAGYFQNVQHVPLAAAVAPEIRWYRKRPEISLDTVYEDLLREFDDCGADNLILSSEGFGENKVSPDRIRQIRDKLAGLDVTVIAYIRRQDAYMLSTYQEGIKSGPANAPFVFDDFRESRPLRFSNRLAPWREVFGRDKVIVRPFDRRFWTDGDLTLDFLSAIGAPSEGVVPAELMNEGLDYRVVEVMRRMKKAKRRQRKAGGAKYPLWKMGRHLVQVSNALGAPQKLSLSSEQSNLMREFFREDNIDSLDGTGIDVDDFFPETPESPDPGTISIPLQREYMLQLLMEMSADHVRSKKDK